MIVLFSSHMTDDDIHVMFEFPSQHLQIHRILFTPHYTHMIIGGRQEFDEAEIFQKCLFFQTSLALMRKCLDFHLIMEIRFICLIEI